MRTLLFVALCFVVSSLPAEEPPAFSMIPNDVSGQSAPAFRCIPDAAETQQLPTFSMFLPIAIQPKVRLYCWPDKPETIQAMRVLESAGIDYDVKPVPTWVDTLPAVHWSDDGANWKMVRGVKDIKERFGKPDLATNDTATCQCRGSNRAACFCLEKGIPCKCNASTGSVWNMEDGKPISKTGEYANPSVKREAVTVLDTEQAATGRWEYRRYCVGGFCTIRKVWIPN